jgi:hypothetical protein
MEITLFSIVTLLLLPIIINRKKKRLLFPFLRENECNGRYECNDWHSNYEQ